MLRIENLSAGFGEETLFEIDHFRISRHEVLGLLGPSGTGKSTLFSAILCKRSNPAYWQKGEIFLDDEPLEAHVIDQNIGVVPQNARLYTGTVYENLISSFKKIAASEDKAWIKIRTTLKYLKLWELIEPILSEPANHQSMGMHKIILIVRELSKRPKLLLLDEPLSNTSLADEKILTPLIQRIKELISVCVITHNKDEAQIYCDTIALISGGVLHEITPSDVFFNKPQTDFGQKFLLSGSAWYVANKDETVSEASKEKALRRFSSLNEFYWIIPDVVAGMQRPGLLTDFDSDLKILKQLEVSLVVSLTQQPIDAALLEAKGIKGHHCAIQDMSIPSINQADQLVDYCIDAVKNGHKIVFHCKAGLGRTGLMLACFLVKYKQMNAILAIETIRSVNHRYIQTEEQFQFVSKYQEHLQQ